ncbi:MAG: TetR/AcrR family transcriptional regulator [Pseudomonadota bacterium]
MATNQTRATILDAAETVFAEAGFAGASMRAIAQRAGVNQPLIHYHFESKDRLYAEVIHRRAADINGQRLSALDALIDRAAPAAPGLEDIVTTLLRPTIELGHDPARGGQHYANLVVALGNGTDERSVRLTAEHYNEVARRFIAAIQSSLPGVGRADAVRGYLYAISIALPQMARTGRAAALSDGLADDSDVETILARTVPFICAGLRALADEPGATLPIQDNKLEREEAG